MPSFQLLAVAVLPILCYGSPINRQVGISENVFMTTQNGTDGLEQRVCSIDAVTYLDGETIPTSSPCEHCVCRPPGFACTITSCEYRPGCKAFRRSDQCCPEYQCECEKDGKIYQNGEKIMDNNNPCEVCYCQGGEIICAVIDCYWRNDCPPRYIDNRCCPMYDHCPPPAAQGPIRQRPSLTSPITLFNLTQLSSTSEPSPSSSPSEASTSSSTTTTTTTTTSVPPTSSTVNPEENSVLSDITVVKEPESGVNELMNDDVAPSETTQQSVDEEKATELPVHDDAAPNVQATPTISDRPVDLESTTIIVPAALELIVQPTNVQTTSIMGSITHIYNDVVAPSSEAPAVTAGSFDDEPAGTTSPVSPEIEKLADATESIPEDNVIFSDSITSESATLAAFLNEDDAKSSQLFDTTAAPNLIHNDEILSTNSPVNEAVQNDENSVPATTVSNELGVKNDLIRGEAISRNDLPESSTVAESEALADAEPTTSVPVLYNDDLEATTSRAILNDNIAHDDVGVDAAEPVPESPAVSNLALEENPTATEAVLSNDDVTTNAPEENIVNDDQLQTEAVPVSHDDLVTTAPSFDEVTEGVAALHDEEAPGTEIVHDDIDATDSPLPSSHDEVVATESSDVVAAHDEVTEGNSVFDDEALIHNQDSVDATESIQVLNDATTEAEVLHVRVDDGNVEIQQHDSDVEATTRAQIVSDEGTQIIESSNQVLQNERYSQAFDEGVTTGSLDVVRDEVVTEGSVARDESVTQQPNHFVNDESVTENNEIVQDETADLNEDDSDGEHDVVTEQAQNPTHDEPEKVQDEPEATTGSSNILVHDDSAAVTNNVIVNDESVTESIHTASHDDPVTEPTNQLVYDESEKIPHDEEDILIHDEAVTGASQVQQDQSTDQVLADEASTPSSQINVNKVHDVPGTEVPASKNKENDIFDIILDDGIIPSQPETLNLIREQADVPNHIPEEDIQSVRNADNDTIEIASLSTVNVEATQQPPTQNDQEIVQHDDISGLENVINSVAVEIATEANNQGVLLSDESATHPSNQNQDELYNDEPTLRMFRDGLEFLNDHEGVPHEEHEDHVHTTTSPVKAENEVEVNNLEILRDHEGVPHEEHEDHVHTTTSPVKAANEVEVNNHEILRDHEGVPHEEHEDHVHTTTSPVKAENEVEVNNLEILRDHEGVPHEEHEDHVHTTASPTKADDNVVLNDFGILRDHEGVPHEEHEDHVHTTTSPVKTENEVAVNNLEILRDHEGVPHEDHEDHVHTTSIPNANDLALNDEPSPTALYDDPIIPTTQLPVNKVQKVAEALAKTNEVIRPIELSSGELPLHKFRLDLDTFRTSYESLENNVVQDDVVAPTTAAPIEQSEEKVNDEGELSQVTTEQTANERLSDGTEQTTQNLLRLRADIIDTESSMENAVYESVQEDGVTTAKSYRNEEATTGAGTYHDDLVDATEGSKHHDEPVVATEVYLRAHLEPEGTTVFSASHDEPMLNDETNEIETSDAVTNSYSFRMALSSEETDKVTEPALHQDQLPTLSPQINERANDDAVPTEASEILQDVATTLTAIFNDEIQVHDETVTQVPSRFRLDLDLATATEATPYDSNDDDPVPSTVIPEVQNLLSDFIEVSTNGPVGFAQEFHDETVSQTEALPQNDEVVTVSYAQVNVDSTGQLNDEAVTTGPVSTNDEPEVTSVPSSDDEPIVNDEVVTSPPSPPAEQSSDNFENDETVTTRSNDDIGTASPHQKSSSLDGEEIIQDEPATSAPSDDEPVTSGFARSGLDELLLDQEVANSTPSNVIFADEVVSTVQSVEKLRTGALHNEIETTESNTILQDETESFTVLQDEVSATTIQSVESSANKSSYSPLHVTGEVILPENGIPKIQPISPDMSRNDHHQLRFDLQIPTEKDSSWLSRAVNQFRRLAGFSTNGHKAANSNPQRENTRRFLFF